MKIKFLAVSALIGFITFTACDSNSIRKSNVTLKNFQDSISYAYGVSSTLQLDGYLLKQGLLKDTMQIAISYNSKIANADASQAEALTKEKKKKISEAVSENKKTVAQVMSGIAAGMRATEKDKAYSFGVGIGQNINQSIEQFEQYFFSDTISKVNKDLLLAGFNNGYGDKQLQDEYSSFMQRKDKEINDQKKLANDIAIQENLKKGLEFLAQNAKKEGVIVLDNGIQYKINKSGAGKQPKADSNVNVDYKGMLIDGTQFDANNGAVLNLGQVIQGWREIIPMMKEGDSWTVYIPSELAYGKTGAGDAILPNSALVFDITLNSVN